MKKYKNRTYLTLFENTKAKNKVYIINNLPYQMLKLSENINLSFHQKVKVIKKKDNYKNIF